MNEEDLMIQEKIKKREKTDLMLACMLIVILLGSILFVVYLKFIRKDTTNNSVSENNDNTPTEYTVNYIKLSDIASGINNNLSSKYSGISATSGDNSINVSYGDLLYEIKLVNNELEFNIDNDNKELSEDIYKEIIASVCTYYSSDRTGCVNASSSVDNGTNGIRFLNNKVYISITNGVTPIDVVTKATYKEETIVVINNTNYEINMNDKIISDIEVDIGNTDVTIGGVVSSAGVITIKLYDDDNELLDTKEFECQDYFSISFDFDDKLNIESIKKYSISIE